MRGHPLTAARLAPALAALVLHGAAEAAAAQQRVTADSVRESGLHTTTFGTLNGRVTVYLPDDLAAGDTLSGIVTAEPVGRDDAARARAASTLEGYVVAIASQQARAGESLRFAIAGDASAASIPLVLRDAQGREVSRVDVPVVRALAATAVAPPQPSDYALPEIGQSGHPLQIAGRFDGDSGSTTIRIGGRDGKVLAESPRQAIVEAPAGVVGPTDVELVERDVMVSGPLRVVRVDLSAPRTALKAGETTRLAVEVLGLEGLDAPLPLRVVNRTPAVVTLEGGDEQVLTVEPGDVSPGGSFTATRTVTGVRPGGWRLRGGACSFEGAVWVLCDP